MSVADAGSSHPSGDAGCGRCRCCATTTIRTIAGQYALVSVRNSSDTLRAYTISSTPGVKRVLLRSPSAVLTTVRLAVADAGRQSAGIISTV